MRIIKWGIMGLGKISNSFVKGLKSLPDAEVVAVGSRSIDKAVDFAKEYDIAKAYGSYQELANDPEVDIIYVSTIHPSHKECALICLNAGKAVICEKPFTINSFETEELIKTAREQKVFLTEAMWTRYLPAHVKVRELLLNGAIGDIKMVKVDFGFCCQPNPKSRLLNLELGGGALLDVGVYTIAFTSMVFGGEQPLNITSMSNIGETGADEEFSAILGYEDGKMAVITGAITTNMQDDAWIFGTNGRICISDFWHATNITLYLDGKEKEVIELPYESTGYNYEAVYAMNCLREGKLESDIMPLNETLNIMQTMDSIRTQWGLKYPFE